MVRKIRKAVSSETYNLCKDLFALREHRVGVPTGKGRLSTSRPCRPSGVPSASSLLGPALLAAAAHASLFPSPPAKQFFSNSIIY